VSCAASAGNWVDLDPKCTKAGGNGSRPKAPPVPSSRFCGGGGGGGVESLVPRKPAKERSHRSTAPEAAIKVAMAQPQPVSAPYQPAQPEAVAYQPAPQVDFLADSEHPNLEISDVRLVILATQLSLLLEALSPECMCSAIRRASRLTNRSNTLRDSLGRSPGGCGTACCRTTVRPAPGIRPTPGLCTTAGLCTASGVCPTPGLCTPRLRPAPGLCTTAGLCTPAVRLCPPAPLLQPG